MKKITGAAFGLAMAGVAGVAGAAFVGPEVYGWARGTGMSTYAEWNIFTSPVGPNAADVGMFPAVLPEGWTAPNVAETTGNGFLTSSGNIYSFAGPTAFEVTVPGHGNGDRWVTTVVVQVRTQGTEMGYEGIRAAGRAPVETVELSRSTVLGATVEVLFRFEIPGNPDAVLIEFGAVESSMSLDRVAVDTAAWCGADFNRDGFTDFFDYDDFVTAFEEGGPRSDFNGDGFIDFFDYDDFVVAFEVGC